MDIKIAPSILSADFVRLEDEVEEIKAGGADYVHVDVMDGLFVPNITIGIPVVKSLRKATDMFLDVHLMIDRPHRYVGKFCDAGADLVCFHVEADEPQDILAALDEIKAKGKLAALAIKPKTPGSVILPYLDKLDMVLVMTVEPGLRRAELHGRHAAQDTRHQRAHKGIPPRLRAGGGRRHRRWHRPARRGRGRKCACRGQRRVRQARQSGGNSRHPHGRGREAII